MVAEICELAGDVARNNQKVRITSKHIQIAIRTDDELNKFMEGVIIPEGGTVVQVRK